MMYGAMFDEVDEGTAMFKVAASHQDAPAGVALVTLDADGEQVPSDLLPAAGAGCPKGTPSTLALRPPLLGSTGGNDAARA